MNEYKQNLKKLYKIFKTTKFPLYNQIHSEQSRGNRNLLLKYNYKPLSKEYFMKDNIYFISRLYKADKYMEKRNLKGGIFKIKSLDKNHPDYQLIQDTKTKLKTNNFLNKSHNNDLYKVSTKIFGSEFVESNKSKRYNNLLNILNDKDDFDYRILLRKIKKKKKIKISFLNFKNAKTSSHKSFVEKKDYNKFPPVKNKLLKQYLEINKEDN